MMPEGLLPNVNHTDSYTSQFDMVALKLPILVRAYQIGTQCISLLFHGENAKNFRMELMMVSFSPRPPPWEHLPDPLLYLCVKVGAFSLSLSVAKVLTLDEQLAEPEHE